MDNEKYAQLLDHFFHLSLQLRKEIKQKIETSMIEDEWINWLEVIVSNKLNVN